VLAAAVLAAAVLAAAVLAVKVADPRQISGHPPSNSQNTPFIRRLL
jgi:hypothetical protein